MILDILYAILIQPIEWGMGWVFTQSFDFLHSYGLAIILLSLVVNIALIPVYLISDSWQAQERAIQERMRSKLDEIKLAFAGQERFMMTRMLYKINNYHPLMAVRSSVGLLIQVPFFFAAYQLLSNYDALNNVSFFIFNDLSKPDGLLSIGNWHINIMPFVMTAINLASAYVYASNLSKKDKIQVYVIAGIFLVVLYSMPVALVLYWTMNNVFSLVKNLIYKRFPKRKTSENNRDLKDDKFRGFKESTLLIFFGTATAFIFVPLFMISSQPEEYRFIDTGIFIKAAFYFTLLSTIVFGIINYILYAIKLKKLSVFSIYFSLAWIITAGFIFSVSASTGMVDPELNPVDKLNFYIVLAVSILIAFLSLSKIKRHIQIFLLVVFVTAAIPATFTSYKEVLNKTDSNMHTSLKLSNKKNILVISFDGLPGEITKNVINESKYYKESLKDFIFFDNAVSHAPATAASLMGDIYGVQDFKSKGETLADTLAKLKEEGAFTNITSQHIPDSYQYGYAGYDIDSMEISSPVVNAQNKSDTFDYFKYAIVRVFSSKLLRNIDYEKNTLVLKNLIVKETVVLDLVEKLENHKGAGWDKPNIATINLFDNFVSDLNSSNKDISLRYMHFVFSHFPVDFDRSCNYRSNDQEWFSANQNEIGLKNQTHCAVGKFVGFIDKLKKLDIYDNSLIVFKSDHGEPVSYFSEKPNNLKINQHAYWGYNRYRPTLMVKDFGKRIDREKVEIKNNLVLLNDIAQTVCERSAVGNDCSAFNGVNLLTDSVESDDSYYIYVVKDSVSSFDFSTHISVEIPSRKLSLIEGMERSGVIELSE